MDIPHNFSTLLNPDASPLPILLIGAGMSFGIAPPVRALAREIRDNHNKIIEQLGIDPSPPPDDQFYDWADRAFSQLKTERGFTDIEAKMLLAAAMGITTDPRFHAKVGMPLRGNTPRHRIVARFAREGRWKSIWSLNWDCVLETALESVGLLNHPAPENLINNPLPWKRWYCTWSPKDTHSPASKACTLSIIKPHGCVRKLVSGSSLFIVTRTELGRLTDELQAVPGRVAVDISDSPLTVVGWSAEEDYLHQNIQAVNAQDTLANSPDRLSIIDPFWSPTPPSTDNKNHNRLASAFNTDKFGCHFSINADGQPTTDDFFHWLQTRFGLNRMHVYANAQGNGWLNHVAELDNIMATFSEPCSGHWLNWLFDDFLAVWVRLCFNAGRVIYKNNSAPVPQDLVATHRRDEHIPWGFSHTDRYDLLAIIPFMLAIWRSERCRWDFAEFPGALWDSSNGHLVLPLPAWDKSGQPVELAALKPLMECWNWANKGAIHRLSILPLLAQPHYSAVTDDNLVLRGSVAWLMKANKFANSENIGVISLSDL